jgi:putative tricarboxylic transport membrane protein
MKRVDKAGRGELAFAGSLLLLGFFVLYDTKKMEVADGVAIISPRLFPYFVGTFLIVVSAGLILTILRGNLAVPEGTEPGDAFVPADFKTMSLVVAGIAGHVILLEKIGFIVAAAVSFYLVAYAFGARRIVKDLAIAIAFAVISYYAFTKGLNIRLPQGIFENLFSSEA